MANDAIRVRAIPNNAVYSICSSMLKQIVEALVFASAKPISIKEIVAALVRAAEQTEEESVRALGTTTDAEVAVALAELQVDYIQTGRALSVIEHAGGWKLVTDPSVVIWVRQLFPEARPTRLSGPQLETLAIIAYRQPVTRADIEAVRGVAVDGMMQVLLDRSLVRIVGRAEQAGRPLLYGTTEYFLQHFGLKHVEELPNVDELRTVALPKAQTPEEKEKAEKAKAEAKAKESSII